MLLQKLCSDIYLMLALILHTITQVVFFFFYDYVYLEDKNNRLELSDVSSHRASGNAVEESLDRLPTSATCMNLLKLPPYTRFVLG